MVVFGRPTVRRVTVLVTTGGWAMPRVVAGRFGVGTIIFSVLVGCQVRERTGPTGSLLSMARFNLKKKKKKIMIGLKQSLLIRGEILSILPWPKGQFIKKWSFAPVVASSYFKPFLTVNLFNDQKNS